MPKPRKADIQRLQKLVDRWNEEERNLQSHYGPAEPGTTRSSRMKDAAALAAVLVHVTGEALNATQEREAVQATVGRMVSTRSVKGSSRG